ncbi:Protein of unknown function [Bacillus wiedmannii]|nr:Protein of unknown function [Bacillus wiedmannii]
MHLKHH